MVMTGSRESDDRELVGETVPGLYFLGLNWKTQVSAYVY